MTTAPGAPSWKELLYERYVSSGQATTGLGSQAVSKERYLSSRRPYLRRLVRHFMPGDRDARIVDLGCGYGALTHLLAESGFRNVKGVDASSEQVALARELGVGNVSCEAIGTFLDRADGGAFDVILLMDVLEHMERQELLDLIIAVRRVLAPKGRCIAHVPNGSGIFGMRVRYGDLTHEIAFTESSARQAFRAVGFRQVRVIEDTPVVHGVKSLIRRLLWTALTIPFRLLHAAETGRGHAILSQSMLIVADV